LIPVFLVGIFDNTKLGKRCAKMPANLTVERHETASSQRKLVIRAEEKLSGSLLMQ